MVEKLSGTGSRRKRRPRPAPCPFLRGLSPGEANAISETAATWSKRQRAMIPAELDLNKLCNWGEIEKTAGLTAQRVNVSGYRVNRLSKQLIKRPPLSSAHPRIGRAQMGWVVALVTITALAMLGFMLWRLDGDNGWRDQAKGLRQRMERDGLPHA